MKKALQLMKKLRTQAEEASAALPDLMFRSRQIAESILHGEHARRKPGSGNDFWQFREYMQTDRPEDIDWRQSAKGDKVFIRQKEWMVTRKSFFWCGGGKSMNFNSFAQKSVYTKGQSAQIISLALALIMRRSYEQIGAYGQMSGGRGERSVERLGQYLLDRADASGENANLPDISSGLLTKNAIFIGVGDFLCPIEDIKQRFEALGRQSEKGLIVQVLDPAELELDFSGRVKFKGVSSKEVNIIDNVANIRQSYKRRIYEHIKQVKQACAVNGWHYYLHRTDENITRALIKIRISLEKERTNERAIL